MLDGRTKLIVFSSNLVRTHTHAKHLHLKSTFYFFSHINHFILFVVAANQQFMKPPGKQILRKHKSGKWQSLLFPSICASESSDPRCCFTPTNQKEQDGSYLRPHIPS